MRALQPTRTPNRRRFLVTATVALLLVLAAPAIAQRGGSATRGEMRGEGYLEGRNDEDRTLQVEDLLVRVTDDTRIYDADSRRISFDKIPSLDGGATVVVEYSGRAAGREQMIAERLVVRLEPR